jgi:hypothetical protein
MSKGARGVGHRDLTGGEHRSQVALQGFVAPGEAIGGDAEEALDAARFRAVAVAFSLGEIGHEDLEGQEKRIEERGVDPGEEVGIVGGIAGACRMGSMAGGDLTVNAIVDRVDARGSAARLLVGSEGEGEHRLEGAPETAHMTMGLTQERAVLSDSLRHEWMGELQEDCPAPAREERHLAMEPPAHRARPERWCSIHGRPPLARYGDSAARIRRQSPRVSA